MLPMDFPVGRVLGGQGRIAKEQHVLRMLLLSRLGEVEASRDDGFAVDDDDFVKGNGVFRVDHGRHALIGQKIGRGILLGALALVEDDLYLDAAPVGPSVSSSAVIVPQVRVSCPSGVRTRAATVFLCTSNRLLKISIFDPARGGSSGTICQAHC
jgi:hypothetical protein